MSTIRKDGWTGPVGQATTVPRMPKLSGAMTTDVGVLVGTEGRRLDGVASDRNGTRGPTRRNPTRRAVLVVVAVVTATRPMTTLIPIMYLPGKTKRKYAGKKKGRRLQWVKSGLIITDIVAVFTIQWTCVTLMGPWETDGMR